MKTRTSLLVLITTFCVAAPVTGFSGGAVYFGAGRCAPRVSVGYGAGYCAPRVNVGYRGGYYAPRPYYGYASRGYCAPRPYYGYGGSYGYSPYAYGTSVAVSYYSAPAVYAERPVYRGVQRAVYSEDLAVGVQRALSKRGYYRGAIDGDIGNGSRAAIRAYQYDHRLEVTGRIDTALLRSLRLA